MEIMKFYKKALLATAIATTFGANAATIGVNNIQKLSAEGVAAGLQAADAQLIFDVIVEKNHPAASRITLSFDSNVELGDLTECADDTTFGSVVTDPASGNGVCGLLGSFGSPAVDQYALQFDYGTGSFTFDNVLVVDGDATKGETDSISFDVNLGNPLVADSAFRVIIGNSTLDASPSTLSSLKGEAYVNYQSKTADGSAVIETGQGKIADVESQFSFKVNTKFDGIIDRDDLTTFVDGTVDATKYTFVNNPGLLASIDLDNVYVTYAGNFKSVDDAELDTSSVLRPGDLVAQTYAADVILDKAGKEVAVEHNLTNVFNDFNTGNSKRSYVGEIEFNRDTNVASAIPTTTPTVVTVTFDSTMVGLTKAIDGQVIATDIDGGEWKIDATIINVPYYVINHADTQSNIHMANEADEVADVIVSAIDDSGMEYGPVDLGIDLAGNTVTKIKPAQLKEALGIDDKTRKLSITFNIDGYAQDVAAYAFSQNSFGRSEVSNSQYKVDGKVVKTK
jgi:hypothetical protein